MKEMPSIWWTWLLNLWVGYTDKTISGIDILSMIRGMPAEVGDSCVPHAKKGKNSIAWWFFFDAKCAIFGTIASLIRRLVRETHLPVIYRQQEAAVKHTKVTASVVFLCVQWSVITYGIQLGSSACVCEVTYPLWCSKINLQYFFFLTESVRARICRFYTASFPILYGNT